MAICTRLLLLFLTFSLYACRRPDCTQKFPIGIFAVESPEAMQTIADAGFDSIKVYTRTPSKLDVMAKAAKSAGLEMLIQPHELMASTISPVGMPVLAWYLRDEPGVNGVMPSELSGLNKRVRAWYQDSCTTYVVGHSAYAARFRDSADVIMIDWYPVPHLPLTSAGDHVRATKIAAERRPVWAVLQAMNWINYPQRDESKPRIGRFPTAHEMRFMTYHSILEGARGIWYFAFTRPSGKWLSDAPELWSAIKRLTRELNALRPVFLNSAAEPVSENLSDGVIAQKWRYRFRDYVILANTTSAPALFPARFLEKSWRPLFDSSRRVQTSLLEENEERYFGPFQVVVIEGPISLRR